MAKGKGRRIFHQPSHAPSQGSQSIAGKLQQAIAMHQQGVLWQAAALYREILKVQPRNFDALHLLGVLEAQNGNFAEAVDLIGRAIKRNSGNAAAQSNMGNALLDLNRLPEALASYDRALSLNPDYIEAHANRGNALLALHRPAEALASYDRALGLNPCYVNALCGRGNALGDLKRHEEALASYDRALEIHPDHVEALNNRGTALVALERHEEALASYDRVLALRPDHAVALNNRGNALLKLQRPAEALEGYDRALAVAPGYLEARANRGNALHELGRHAEALVSYDLALSSAAGHGGARPPGFDYAAVLVNRGNVLRDLKRHEEALASFEGALAFRPEYAEALYNSGAVLTDLKRHAEASRVYEKLLDLAPDHDYALGNLLRSRQLCCDWKQHAQTVASVVDAVGQGKRASTPFSFLAVTHSAAAQLQCARTWADDRYPESPSSCWTGPRHAHEKIRLAYVSADFRDHAMSFLMAGLFEKHDRERFETIAISLHPASPDTMGQRVRAAFDRFVDVAGKTDSEIADLMRELEVDIAVDLMGFTADGRTRIFARRCAPLQVNYLGFPATMAARYMDYIIADDFVIPEPIRVHYSEQVVYLPDSFQANDDRRRIGESTPARPEAGLPEAGFVFCSFNNSYKINPAIFDVWMRLLRTLESSVLWLVADGPSVQDALRAEAAKRGVDPQRLVFAQRLPYADHLARLRLADLFLDTLPFNAGTTASDALWAGVPVLTCAGEAFAARMAGSLLRAAGLPELITDTPESYETLALKLATDPEMLRDIKARLARNRTTCPLFNTDRFRRHIESAYVTMWERYHRGEPPASFAVQPVP